jgi:hypothetical protein
MAIIRRAASPPTPKGTAATPIVALKPKRINHAHRAVAASCDPKGKFASPEKMFVTFLVCGCRSALNLSHSMTCLEPDAEIAKDF